DVCSSDLGHVLAQGGDGFPGDDLAADRGLDRDLEEVPGDEVLQALAKLPAARFRRAAVDDHAERVDRLAIDQDVHLDEVAGAVADLVIVKRGVAARYRLQPVVEVEHHLVQGQLVGHLGAAGDIGEALLDAAPVLAELEDRAEMRVGDVDRRLDPRLLHLLDMVGLGPVGGVVDLARRAVGQQHLVDHARRGGDEIEIIFAGEPLLDDLEVEEAEEAAAEAEAQRRARLHLEAEAGVVEPEPGEALAQLLEIGRVGGEESAEDDRLHLLEAGQRLGGGLLRVGDRVADAGLADILDLGGDEADLAGAELAQLLDLGLEDADAVDQVGGAGLHEPDLLAFPDRAVDDADQDDDAEIGVVPRIDEHRLQA